METMNKESLYKIKGTFDYFPKCGYRMSKAGYHELTVTFYPEYSNIYEEFEAKNVLYVSKISPRVEWWYPVSV